RRAALPPRPAARHSRPARALAMGADAGRLPDDEPVGGRAPADAAAPALAEGDALEPRAGGSAGGQLGGGRWNGRRAAAPGDGERRRLHAARGRARAGEPDRPAEGVRTVSAAGAIR